MEVSGKKGKQTFAASFTKSSAECFDFYCEPCDGDGKHVEAQGYCKNCQEFLCTTCLESHRRVRLTRNHIILDSDKMPKVQKPRTRDTDCTEKCPQHTKEVIIYYCKGHDEVGCHECMSANHSACVNEYIPEVAIGVKDSLEYKNMLKEIDDLENEARKIEKKAKKGKEMSDHCYTSAIQDIEKCRQDINDQLDKTVDVLTNCAHEEKEKINSAMNDALTESNEVVTIANKTRNEVKRSGASEYDVFVLIKMKKQQLEKCRKTICKCTSIKTISTFQFKPKGDITDNLKSPKAFGDLTFSTAVDDEVDDKLQTQMVPRQCMNLNVKLKTDTGDCDIVDMDMISPHELVLADFNNCSVKVFNINEKRVSDEVKVSPQPFGLTILNKNKIAAVTNYKIMIICKSKKWKLENEVRIDSQCNGIRRFQNHLIIVCYYPIPKVYVLTCEGKVLQTLLSDVDETIISAPHHIALSADGKFTYISDYNSKNKVTRLSMTGEVINVYQSKDKQDIVTQPRGIAVSDDDNVFVCDFFGNKIRKFSADLSSHKTILTEKDGIKKPKSIHLCNTDNRLFIGCGKNNNILVFDLSPKINNPSKQQV